jgi:hypothetical protein
LPTDPIIGLSKAQFKGQGNKIVDYSQRIVTLEKALREIADRYAKYLLRYGNEIELTHQDSYGFYLDVLYD